MKKAILILAVILTGCTPIYKIKSSQEFDYKIQISDWEAEGTTNILQLRCRNTDTLKVYLKDTTIIIHPNIKKGKKIEL